MQSFREALRIQRWDDHRYYHHSRINQTLHLVSALSFLAAYGFLLKDPVLSSLIGWLVAMVSRQVGHLFFEPRGYDEINQATFEHKEEIKVGYNLHRKMILLGIWGAVPLVLVLEPAGFGFLEPHTNFKEFARRVGWVWLWVGCAGLGFRTVQLFFIRDIQTGLVWCTKIITDPFHDIWLYWRAPIFLANGQMLDHEQGRGAAAAP